MAKPGTFQKGQSGNPGGRPAIAKEIKALARERARALGPPGKASQ